jgi:multidrug resistance efflux pump
MSRNRVVTIAVLFGVVLSAVTFIGAAKMFGDDVTGQDPAKSSQFLAGKIGLVMFGNVDIDNGVGLLPVSPETFCKVLKVKVKEGDVVKKGDTLLECDTELAKLTVQEAQNALEEAKGALKVADGQLKNADEYIRAHDYLIEVTEKNVAAKALLLEGYQKDLEEKRKRAEKFGANDPDLQVAEKKLASAQKELDGERVKLEGLQKVRPNSKKDQAQGAVYQATAAVSGRKAQLDKALYGLKLMNLKSPIDGKIDRSMATEGIIFGPQSKMPAFYLQSDGALIVRAEVDQEWASRVAKGLEAEIEDDNNSEQKWTGKVIRVSDCFLPKRTNNGIPEALALNESRVLECIISIDAKPGFIPRYGQRVKVKIAKANDNQPK